MSNNEHDVPSLILLMIVRREQVYFVMNSRSVFPFLLRLERLQCHTSVNVTEYITHPQSHSQSHSLRLLKKPPKYTTPSLSTTLPAAHKQTPSGTHVVDTEEMCYEEPFMT